MDHGLQAFAKLDPAQHHGQTHKALLDETEPSITNLIRFPFTSPHVTTGLHSPPYSFLANAVHTFQYHSKRAGASSVRQFDPGLTS